MSAPHDQFEEVQRLLSCKRYEQPPPGYFHRFSAQVLARIEAEEAYEHSSWWNWLITRFDAKPVLVCAYGLAASGLLFFGFRLSEAFEAEASVSPVLSNTSFAIPSSSALFSQQLAAIGSFDGSEPLLVSAPKQVLRAEPTQLVFPASQPAPSSEFFNFGTQQ